MMRLRELVELYLVAQGHEPHCVRAAPDAVALGSVFGSHYRTNIAALWRGSKLHL